MTAEKVRASFEAGECTLVVLEDGSISILVSDDHYNGRLVAADARRLASVVLKQARGTALARSAAREEFQRTCGVCLGRGRIGNIACPRCGKLTEDERG